jgi:arsenate reductase
LLGNTMKKVVFVCVHNSGRSQMAEAFLNHLAQDKAIAISAGVTPAARVNLKVIAVMREAGIDISHQKPKLLSYEMLQGAERVITMGCGVEEACPATRVPTEDWELEDPEGKPIAQIRQIRDQIRARVEELIGELSD